MATESIGLPGALRACADKLACPVTGEPLVEAASGLVNASGSRVYPLNDGIPELFVPLDPSTAENDVTEMVRAFYEETPFPNYDDLDTRETLKLKARRSLFAAALDEQLSPDAVVFEAGCGTGQMANFLGLSRRRLVLGGDICLNSLRLADAFRRRCGIANVAFLQLNLFRPPFREGVFDVVIANGVLHHTGNPRAGFEALLRTVKPGGVIIVGLYNRLARLPTLCRGWAFKRFGPAAHFLDRRLQSRRRNEARWQAWFRDQYRHPHESRHSIGEVLQWFEANGVEFLCGVPAPDGSPFTARTKLFEAHRRGRKSSHIAIQLQMLLAGGNEGGFFIMIGRKHG